MLEALDVGQRVAVDFVEPAQVAGQRVGFAVDRLAADVLEQVVVRVHAVERGVRGMRLVQVTEQIVDEMRKGFGSNHRFRAYVRALPDELGPPTRSANGTINRVPPTCPARCSWSPRRSATSRTSLLRALRVLREVAVIAAEDTRRTAHLLARHAITTPTTSLHEHNEAAKIAFADRPAASGRERRAGLGCRDADGFGPGRPPDPGGHRGRDSGRADPRTKRRDGGDGGVWLAHRGVHISRLSANSGKRQKRVVRPAPSDGRNGCIL